MSFLTPIFPYFRKTTPFCRKFILILQFQKKPLYVYKLTYTILVILYYLSMLFKTYTPIIQY